MATRFETLDLTTVVERPQVRIDGELYDLKHPDEFSLVQSLRLSRQGQRVIELVTLLTDGVARAAPEVAAAEQEYEQLLDTTCRAVLVAPDAVHARLREDHRVAITRAFTLLQTATLPRAGANAPEGTTTTGTSSSLASAGSMAATPSAG